MEPEPQPALLVYEVGLPSSLPRVGEVPGPLHCVETGDSPGRLWRVDPREPRIQPDLDHGGTKGELCEMVREALDAKRAQLGPHSGMRPGEEYALEQTDEHEHDEDGGCIPGWFDPVTSRSYATEGKAYKAALDHLAGAT